MILPIIVSILYWLGGREQMAIPFNQKLFRQVAIGLAVALFSAVGFFPTVLTCFAYFIATNVFTYGENNPIRKWFGKDIQWLICGFAFGFASLFSLGLLCVGQSVLSAVSSYVLLKWSNDGFESLPYIGDKFPMLYGNKLNQQYVELGIGLFGTILYVFYR